MRNQGCTSKVIKKLLAIVLCGSLLKSNCLTSSDLLIGLSCKVEDRKLVALPWLHDPNQAENKWKAFLNGIHGQSKLQSGSDPDRKGLTVKHSEIIACLCISCMCSCWSKHDGPVTGIHGQNWADIAPKEFLEQCNQQVTHQGDNCCLAKSLVLLQCFMFLLLEKVQILGLA